MNTVLFVIAAYLIGSISFAVVMSRIFGLSDPRTYGSGNPGGAPPSVGQVQRWVDACRVRRRRAGR